MLISVTAFLQDLASCSSTLHTKMFWFPHIESLKTAGLSGISPPIAAPLMQPWPVSCVCVIGSVTVVYCVNRCHCHASVAFTQGHNTFDIAC